MSDSLQLENYTISTPPPVVEKNPLVEARADGWANLASGLGTSKDKRQSGFHTPDCFLTHEVLSGMYSDGLIRRIVNTLPEDMFREWGLVQNDPKDKYDEGIIQRHLMRLRAPQLFREAKEWARLHGGALVYIIMTGTGRPDTPFRVEDASKIKAIEGLRVFDLADIDTNAFEWDTNINSPTYGQVKIYVVRVRTGGTETMMRIHASRCIAFSGERVPASTKMGQNLTQTRYWGISMLQYLFADIRDFRGVMGSVATILQEFIVGKYKFEDLDDMLSASGKEKLQARIAAIEMTKSMINAVMLGTDEDYQRDSANVSGIPDLIDRFMMVLCSSTGYPVTKLFGRSASGLNATGEGDNKNYYDKVRSEQNDVTPGVQYLVDILVGYLKLADGDYSWVWKPLQQLSAEEQNNAIRIEAEAYRTRAAGDQIYLADGVLSAEQVFNLRFSKEPSLAGWEGGSEPPEDDNTPEDTDTEDTTEDDKEDSTEQMNMDGTVRDKPKRRWFSLGSLGGKHK